MERKRGSAWGAVIGAALLALGAERLGTSRIVKLAMEREKAKEAE